MPPGLFRLTKAQIYVLMLLDDGPAEDSVGLELLQLRSCQLDIVQRLKDLGLVEIRYGWRSTLWFRLSVGGRALARTGASSS